MLRKVLFHQASTRSSKLLSVVPIHIATAPTRLTNSLYCSVRLNGTFDLDHLVNDRAILPQPYIEDDLKFPLNETLARLDLEAPFSDCSNSQPSPLDCHG